MIPDWGWVALVALNVFVAIFWLAARLRVTLARSRSAATLRPGLPRPADPVHVPVAAHHAAEPEAVGARVASHGEHRLAEDLARWRRTRRVEETPGLDAWVRESDRGDVGPAAGGGGDRPRPAVNGHGGTPRPSAARQSP
jgi:hypothetical protein